MSSEKKVDEVKTNGGGSGVKKVNVGHDERYKKISSQHEELAKKVSKMDLKNHKNDLSLDELESFNGYYSVQLKLGNNISIAAFISVDTNICVQILKDGTPKRVTSVDIIYPVIKNGVVIGNESYRFDCEKDTFKDNKLEIKNDKLVLSLQFKRQNNSLSTLLMNTIITASMNGSITIDGQLYSVAGGTENNAIPETAWIGEYYEEKTIWIINRITGNEKLVFSVPVLKISDNWKIEYDFGQNDGKLSQVLLYCYNLNMHYFSFYTYDISGCIVLRVKNALIMGTAAAKGLACDAIYDFKSRALVTIPFPRPGHVEYPPPVLMANRHLDMFNRHKEISNKSESSSVSVPNNPNSVLLAPYSGYYQLSFEGYGFGYKGDAPGAFLSIQTNIHYLNGETSDYTVDIGFSLDGKSSLSFKFDKSMRFDGKTLTIPGQFSVTFERKYDNKNGSLVQLEGHIGLFNNVKVTGFNRFNPISLGSFTGKYYNSLPLVTGTENVLVLNIEEMPLFGWYFAWITVVEFFGKQIDNFVYVPIMSTLASVPSKGSEDSVLMSFGTNGIHGNTSMITQFTHGSPATYPIWAQAYGSIDLLTGTSENTNNTNATSGDNDNYVIPTQTAVIKFDNATTSGVDLSGIELTLESASLAQGKWLKKPPQKISGGQQAEWKSTSKTYFTGSRGTVIYSYNQGKDQIAINWDVPYVAPDPSYSCFSTGNPIWFTPGPSSPGQAEVTFVLSTILG